jgi:Transcriptional activator
MQNETQAREQQLQLMRVNNTSHSNRGSSADHEEKEEDDSARSALSVFRAKEEQIERKKMEVREKFFAQLGRVEEESKRLSIVKQVSNNKNSTWKHS